MLLRRRAAVVCFSLLLGARGVFTEQLQQLHEEEPVQVFSNALTDAEVADFEHLIQRGQTTACCGYWAQRAAANLQKFVVQQLHTDRRHLGDVHLDNITAVRGIRDEHSHWSSVAVLYLEDPGSTQVQLQRSSERHEVEVLPVARGSLVQVPEGAVLLHSEPLRVAWTRVRNAEAPPRDFFEFYLASWVQQTFVMPYDTTSQRRFFRKHTRHPRYWHGFLWSFVGTFCTVFPCLPLAWFGLQALARASKGEADSKDEGLSPTLLPRVGRKAGKAERSGPPSFGKAFGDLGLATDMVKDVSKS